MSIATGLTLMGRTQAEALMESTCVITRTTPGVPAVNDDGSLNNTTTTIYSGSCRLRFPTVRPTQVVPEGQSFGKEHGVLSLPVVGDSVGVRADDIAVITVSPILDPGVIVSGRIELPFTQTHATARRFPLEVLS